MTAWVDYKHIRENVKFTDVLEHYRIELNIRGERATGPCPLPNHKGKGRAAPFSAHVERGIWQCFGCRAKGNVIDFLAYMENLNPHDSKEFRKAAVLAKERFLPEDTSPPRRSETPRRAASTLASDKAVVINAPLDFRLKNLELDHPYLCSRGFTPKTIEHFGLGFCSKGLMKDRVVIPLHNQEGQFIGYAGRVVDDAAVSKENPKYRFPGKREHNGEIHEFRKSAFIYNGHAITEPVDDLVVVEGFASVWWLWQHGFDNTVALMGSVCNEAQAEILVGLVSPRGRIWIFPDGDKDGEKCGKGCVLALSKRRFVSWVVLEDKRQPTDCDTKVLQLLLAPSPGALIAT